MKRLLLMFASALLLLGCAEDKLAQSSSDELVAVSFKADASVSGETTRAVADGDGAAAKVNHWVMEVRDSDGDVYVYKEEDGTEGEKTHTFNVSLIKGQTYNVLFWADTKGTYNVADLTNVKLLDAEQTGYAANLDSRDAFSAVVSGFSTTTATSQSVTLKRPFAQLNVIFTDLSSLWGQLISTNEYLKFKPTTFKALAKVPTSFNVQDQTAGTPAATALNITADANYLDNYTTHGAEETLFMDYFFASAGSKDVVDIDFSFVSKGVTVSHKFTSVPFQRNYRTNIKGNLMTADAKWTVTVDPLWDSQTDGSKDINVYYTEVASSSDVKVAIQAKTDDTTKDGKSLSVTVADEVGSGQENDDVIIPDNTPKATTPEIILDFKKLSSNAEIIIRDENHERTAAEATSGANEYEGEIIVVVPEGTTADQVKILTNKSTVTVRGEYGTVIASCAPQTIIVEEGTVIETLKVMKGNVNVLGKVTSIVNSTADEEANKDVVKVFMFEGGVWTNLDNEKGDKLVPVYPLVTLGTNAYFTLTEAMKNASEGGEIKILGNVSETPSFAPEMHIANDILFSASSPVVVTVAPTAKTSTLDTDGMTYMVSTGIKKNITIGENVTLKFPATSEAIGALYFGYSTSTPVNVILNGHIEAYEPYLGSGSSMTINPSGSLTSVSECLIVRQACTMDVDGTDGSWSEETPQINLSYASQQGGIVTFKNTFVNANSWWSMWNRNSRTDVDTKLVLDSTIFIANGFKGSTATVPTYSVVLKNNSVMKINGTFATIDGGTITIEAGSSIEAKAFDNKGKIVVNVPETEGEYLVAKYTGSGSVTMKSFGNVSSNAGSPLVKDNNLYIVID